MSVVKEYAGRKFIESKLYSILDRYIVGISRNNVWLYTVDKCNEINRETGNISDNIIIRIVRWRAINDKKNENIKYWKLFRAYNIRSSNEWAATSAIVDTIIDENRDNSHFDSVTLPKEEYESLKNARDELSELIRKINKLKNVKSATIAELKSFKRKFNLMKANVKEYERVLSEFESLINRENSTETDVHEFVTNNKTFWLFGLEYVDIKSKVKFPPGKRDFEFDIMLKRHDGFWDLAELKGPNENLFDKRTKKRSKPNQKLSEAIGQVFTYLHACDIQGLKNIFKPKAFIVIGNEKTDNVKERRLFSSYLNNVELITYSELYQRGKKLLEYIKNTTLT